MTIIDSAGPQEKRRWPLIYTAVALTTSATLLLELSLTRIFSVVFFYHFAFLAISIALFGLGAGGVVSYYFASAGRALYLRLGALSAAAAIVTVASLVFILRIEGSGGIQPVAAVYFAAAAPFLLAGVVLSLTVAETIQRVDRIYFCDLLGAAAGCLLLIPLLNFFGGPNTVLSGAFLYAAAAVLWFLVAGSMAGRIAGSSLAVALVLLIAFNSQGSLIDIRFAKQSRLEREIFVQWNSFSRVAVRQEGDGALTANIDADASTVISPFDIDNLGEQDRRELARSGPAFVFRLRPPAKTLILGSGGGLDVARALASGAKNVTAVEINPIIARTIMQRRMARESRFLYLRPEVRVFVEDGRSFVRRSAEHYDVIQATLVDTWASTAAGAFALSESTIYTTEAFLDYLRHLTPNGLLSFTRFGFTPPRESLRLVALARAALQILGEPEPWRHIVVLREGAENTAAWSSLDTVLISRKPLSSADLAQVRACAAGEFQISYLPGATDGPFAQLLRAGDPDSFYKDYPYNVAPVSDDRPFFFYTVQPRDLLNFRREGNPGAPDFKVNLAVPTLFGSLSASSAATLVILLLPPVLLKERLPRGRGVMGFLPYFACLGAGYMFIQVALIQKLVLFLGHPTYALTVAVFSMLLASGAGSYFSRRVVRDSAPRLRTLLFSVSGVVAFFALGVAPLTSSLAWLPLGFKMAVTVLLIAPAAFLMGMPFPSGLARIEAWHAPSVKWAWALNSGASVLGSGFAVFFAIYTGLRNTLLLGALLYAVAALIVSAARRQRAPE